MLRAVFGGVLLAGLLAAAAMADSSSDKRVALVVGNSRYQHVPALDNPKNDARLIAKTLTALGFKVVGDGPQIDLNRVDFENSIRLFGREIAGADVALFYYAGHGLQVQGTNWLVPVTANPEGVTDLDYEMIDADLVVKQMQAARTHLNLVILDACRVNPFGGRGIRDVGGGLAQMRAPEGTLISYATQPGNVARDGSDGDSPYTKALAAAMGTPGLGLFQVFNQVGLRVKRATSGDQEPWLSSSPIDGEFYFSRLAPDESKSGPGAEPATVTLAPTVDKETLFWESIKESKNSADFEAYVKQYPSGAFAPLARNRIIALQATGGPSSQKVPPPAKPAVPAVSAPGHNQEAMLPPSANMAPPIVPALAHNQWRGMFYYPIGDKRAPVPFTLQLQVDGAAISGRTVEPATFGDGSSPNLYATISGNILGTRLSFTKTYDGTGGVKHSVEYAGTIAADGTSLSGLWHIGDFGGSFNAAAVISTNP